mmetsp:Transcript_26502/g.41106  ORF Transcript_26502/g.41106 Transcript_26502/m.41106 type:complete len:284 (-) Transcript_26502:371-1222(-)|eukprot:CAMPEP_0196816150 /NCGR_PEP_ID=MMETSP1362-20130617/53715_1 /TAXON_ID=163516 /ORGANISM="Leptocylindrus danicus, Strain CCMP1856" /LENGTH=283 /DNA_ID=CAMNT_0042193371 /DNA_START=78 /DNA_END=929 /DNA_ORIENTATION=-
MTTTSISVGFIGAGMMASALMDGLVAKEVCAPSDLSCSDIWQPALDKAASNGISTFKSNEELLKSKQHTAIVLAVKPQIISQACQDVVAAASDDTLVVSIAAGVTLSTLQSLLPGKRIVRVMPNTPCLVGMAAAGFAVGDLCTDDDVGVIKQIFGAVGIGIQVQEKLLDAVTGLSGSGPAYVFQFIEALSDGGVRAGLPRDVATQLAAQTVKGAAEMVLATGKHPGLLKDGVTSPGGTTIAGVEALEKGGLRAATISAVTAATKRSMQLGGMSDADIANKHGL